MEARTGRRWIGVVVTLLIAAPAIAAIVALAGRHWWPTDDFAIIDLRVRDVFTANSPLTGLYSRPGWNHPGPIMFWVMAPLSWVSGHAPWATRIGGAVMQAVALVWLGIATARRGTRWVLAAGLVASFTFLASDQWLFREPWNLHIPVPYFVLFLFLTCFVALGETRQLVAMSIAATVMVSTHIGYAPLVVVGFAYAGCWIALDTRRTGVRPPRLGRTLAWCAVVWLVTWSAPILDVLLHWPGNLGKIVKYFAGGHASVGLGNAVRFTADEFRLFPPWLGGPRHAQLFTGFAVAASAAWLVVPFVLIVLAAILLRRRPDREQLRSLGCAVLMLLTTVVAISGADEPRYYTFQWRSAVAAFLFVACLAPVVSAIRSPLERRSPRWRAVGALLAVGVVAWGSVVMTDSVVRGPSAFLAAREPDLRAVMAIIDRMPPVRGPVRLRHVGRSLPSLYDGIVNELLRRGVDVRVDPALGRVFGGRRTTPSERRLMTWYVTEEGSRVASLLRFPGARLVAQVTPLSAAENRELDVLQARIGRALDAAGRSKLRSQLDTSLAAFALTGVAGVVPADLKRMTELSARVEQHEGCRCAIVAVPHVGIAPARGT